MQRFSQVIVLFAFALLLASPADAAPNTDPNHKVYRAYGIGYGQDTNPQYGFDISTWDKVVAAVKCLGAMPWVNMMRRAAPLDVVQAGIKHSSLTQEQYCQAFGRAVVDLILGGKFKPDPAIAPSGTRIHALAYASGALDYYREWTYAPTDAYARGKAAYWPITVEFGPEEHRVTVTWGWIISCRNFELLAVGEFKETKKPPPPPVTELTPSAEVGQVTEAREYHTRLVQAGVMSYGETPIQTSAAPYVPGVTFKQSTKEGGEGETVFTAPAGSGRMTLDQALVGTGSAAGSATGGGTVANAVTSAIAGGQSGAINFTIPGGTWVIRRP